MKNEELRAAEMNVCICEPEQGSILGEDENEGTDEIQGSHDFESNEICMHAGVAGIKGEGQSLRTFTR